MCLIASVSSGFDLGIDLGIDLGFDLGHGNITAILRVSRSVGSLVVPASVSSTALPRGHCPICLGRIKRPKSLRARGPFC